jgi:uncharacterized protein involved in exopolysaccharide biosynthesis
MKNNETAYLPKEFIQPGMTLGQLLAILKAAWWKIAALTALIAVAAAGVSLSLPKTYEATATLLVDFEINDPLSGREFPSMLVNSYMATQVDYITSHKVLLPVIDKLNWVNDNKRTAGYKGDDKGLRIYLVDKQLYTNLKVGTGKDSRLIYITFQGSNAAEVAKVVNTVAQVYLEQQLQRLAGPAQQRALQFSEQINTQKINLDEAQKALSDFREENNLIDVDARIDVESQKLLDLTARLSNAEAEERAARIRFEQLNAQRDSLVEDPQFGSTLYVQNLKSQLLQLEAKFNETQQVLGPRHPDYQTQASEIQNLREKIARESSGYRSNAQVVTQKSSGVVTQLKAEVAAQRENVLRIRKLQDEAAVLNQKIDIAKQLYNKSLADFEPIQRTAQSRYNNTSLVAPASVPNKHIKPILTVNIILGTVVGLFISIFAFLFVELLNRKVRHKDDFERDLGIPLLAHL